MPSSPTHKNLGALIEQPDSRAVRSDGPLTETRIYAADYDTCRAAVKVKGAGGSGDLTGYIIQSSILTPQRGEWAKLTDTWVAGGPDADPETIPLPEDTFSLQSQDLNPSVEKNIGFADCALDTTRYDATGATGTTADHKTLIAWVREAGLSTEPTVSNPAWNALVGFVSSPGGDEFDQALVLADLLRRGIQNFYKASFVYTWTQYFYSEPTITVGGFIQTPGGPLASAIAGLGLVCLAQADDLSYDGQFYQLTNKWICALDDNETHWEPVLYTP